jgi:chromosome condensin MukBEF ATPase and DNA-binding subunit MukB
LLGLAGARLSSSLQKRTEMTEKNRNLLADARLSSSLQKKTEKTEKNRNFCLRQATATITLTNINANVNLNVNLNYYELVLHELSVVIKDF